MKMYIIGVLMVFTALWEDAMSGTGLHCYKCEAESGDASRLCEKFDYSAPYTQDCDNSSMCYKKITNSPYVAPIYERGCAKQTYDDYMELGKDGRWHDVLKLNEIYNEGCVELASNAERVTKTSFCYCRGDLCNGVSEHGLAISLAVSSLLVLIYL